MSTNKLEQESRYDILQNKEGEILIIINSREGGPEEPRFVYDGGKTALLYRTKEMAVVFKDIATSDVNQSLVPNVPSVEIEQLGLTVSLLIFFSHVPTLPALSFTYPYTFVVPTLDKEYVDNLL
jgi:hypothetical protein